MPAGAVPSDGWFPQLLYRGTLSSVRISCLQKACRQYDGGQDAYFGNEQDDIDCIVKYVDHNEGLYGAMESIAPVYHKYRNILQEDGNLDCDYNWTING